MTRQSRLSQFFTDRQPRFKDTSAKCYSRIDRFNDHLGRLRRDRSESLFVPTWLSRQETATETGTGDRTAPTIKNLKPTQLNPDNSPVLSLKLSISCPIRFKIERYRLQSRVPSGYSICRPGRICPPTGSADWRWCGSCRRACCCRTGSSSCRAAISRLP